jgi:NADH-quinone oxidoreductase subunit C
MGIMLDHILLQRLLNFFFPKSQLKMTGNELVLRLDEKKDLFPTFFHLKNHSEFQFESLMDLFGVDYPSRGRRYEVHYLLGSVKYNQRLRVVIEVGVDEVVPSLVSLYPSSNWLEREVWDMFGIFFENHPDLRRILTDYGFEGFPLRKDFPISGFLEVRYDESEKRVIYEPVELTQEYRLFQFLSPWEKK